MKKLFASWNRLRRSTRAVLNIVAIFLCLTIILILCDLPSFTAEMQYRRLEKQHMIGPAQILGTESLYEDGTTKLLIAKSNTEVMLHYYQDGDYDNYNSTDLVCRKKQGALTILAAGGSTPRYSTYSDISLPIILFDEYPEAVRAEVEFTLYFGDYKDAGHTVPYEKHFNLDAARTNEGYFCFYIQCKAYTNTKYTSMLTTLAAISAGYHTSSDTNKYTPIPVTVHLYDKNDQLIVDEIIYFRTIEDDFATP